MSHFVGLVFGNNIEELLEPYDENLEVAPYILYTKNEAIDEIKIRHAKNYEHAIKLINSYKNSINEWEQDKFERANKIIEKGLFISYEDAWEEAKKWGYEIDKEENLLSKYNPKSRWDWYIEGGRWEDWLLLKEKGKNGEPLSAIFATKEEVDWDIMLKKNRIPFCFVTEDGDWHESAKMGWWCFTSNEKNKDDWKREFLNYLQTVDNDVNISVIDFHI